LSVQVKLEQDVLGAKAVDRWVVDVIADSHQTILSDLFD
jgi:hypothetical protein